MTTDGSVGSVAALWRFPVKSMQGERLAQAELAAQGLIGDRAYALVDAETGKVASAKSVRHFPDLLRCQASYTEAPQEGKELPAVRITLPDGQTVTSDAGDVDRVLSAWFRREVTLARSAPQDFTIDQYHPDVEDADPAGHRDAFVEQKLGSALFSQAGLASPVPEGAFFDVFPLSVLTTSTLEQLTELRPGSRFDERRFRMNLIVGTTEAGFVEDAWVSHQLAIGKTVRIRVSMLDPRCVMPTLAQDGLPADLDILRTLVQHNRVQVGDLGRFPCAGAYAVIESPGRLRVGDSVALA